MSSRPLFSLLREGYEEVRADGEMVVCRGDAIVYQSDEATGRYPARSLLKPFQYLSTGLGPPRGRHLAALGSISATEEQVAALEAWYALEPERLLLLQKLKLAPAYPLDEAHRALLRRATRPPSALFHPCFSKHVAILEACAAHRWNDQTYTSTEHPFHLRLRDTLGSLLGAPPLVFVTDGCLLPSPVLTTSEIARLYRLLSSGRTGSALGDIAAAMLAAPEWIGGPGRLDTRIMQANPGRVIAKEGADGLLAVGVLATDADEALGIVLKMTAGYLPRLCAIALGPLFEALGLVPPSEPTIGHTVQHHARPFRDPRLACLDISPSLGDKTAVWPGDVPFRRDLTSDTWAESGITVSCIHTTVHFGAHADAPNHLDHSLPGIDAVDLRRYLGLCQVIEARGAPGSVILPSLLTHIEMRAPRILLKTGSFPDIQHFNEDFVACSGELIAWLAARGVVLIGIDTPSIDPCHSKSLPAHHAAIALDMAILEGIVLDGVAPGLYELIALPLKLEGADASPVRAVLRPYP